MQNFEPIYVDPSRSAALNHGATTVDCPTLGEAVVAFKKLPANKKEVATIDYLGKSYSASEIKRFVAKSSGPA